MDLMQSLRYRAARVFARNTISLTSRSPLVSFSFDDFPKSAGVAGEDVLSAYGFRATYYFCADFAGKTVDGVRQYDVEDLARLVENGHELGCHTASHRPLSGLSRSEVHEDIAQNAAFLAEAGIDAGLRTFAYPFGDLSVFNKVHLMPKFAACRGAWAGVNTGVVDLSLLKCVCLEPHILRARPVEGWLDEALRTGGWLIFLTHDVSDKPSPYGVTQTHFRDIVDTVSRAGVDVLPVGGALDRIRDAG